jgi:hypothetical protein
VQEILELNSDEQRRLLLRLTDYANGKMKKLTWRGAYVARGGSVPGGHEPEDFALQAFKKALAGRAWNRESYPTLEYFLRSIIDGDISHLVVSADNIHGRRLLSPSDNDETARAYEVQCPESKPIQLVIDREWQDRFHKAAIKELEGDDLLMKLLKCLEEGFSEPAEIAILLDTSAEEIYNAKKRLRRKLDKLDTRIRPIKRIKS